MKKGVHLHKTADDGYGCRVYEVRVDGRLVGEVYNAGPGRWHLSDENGKPLTSGWNFYETRRDAVDALVNP